MSETTQTHAHEQGETITVCYRHPETETTLRCNRCGKPICTKCAELTDVGYRCPDCVREQQNKFYTGGSVDYVLAVVVALPMSLIAGAVFTLLIGNFGFFSWIISFFAGPATGGLIAEAVRRAVGRRRSRYLSTVVAACLVIGVAPFLLLMLLGGNFFGLIAPGILLFTGVPAIVYRLH